MSCPCCHFLALLVVHLKALEAALFFSSSCLPSHALAPPDLMGFLYLPGHRSLWVVTSLELEKG